MPRVIVVGAGVAGLAAAHRLQQQGCEVTVLERDDHVGGKTASVQIDGFRVNTGATVLAGSYDAMLAIAREIGVEDQVFAPPAVISVARDGLVHELRGEGFGGIVDFVRTPLLSVRSKLKLGRMAGDLLRARTRAGFGDPAGRAELDTETVREYCDRRLNAEIRDGLLDPVLGGIFVMDGKSMSMADLWVTIWKVLLGGLRGYTGGIDFFARALAERLDVRTGATVTSVVREGRGARVRWLTAEGGDEEFVDGVVLTVPAPHVPELFEELDPTLQGMLLEGLQQVNYIGIRLGLSRRPATRSLLTVAGRDELGGISTVMYEHQLSRGSAPEGKGLLGVLLYDEWATPRLSWTDDELISAVLPHLERVEPGVTDQIEFAKVTRWTPAAIRMTKGTHKLIAEIDRTINPNDPVQLAGDYMAMPSINGSVLSGETAATRLQQAMSGR